LALVLAGILGASRLFQQTTLGPQGLTASAVVRFLGGGAALLLVWFGAARASRSLRDDRGWRSLLRHTLVSLATLVVLGVGYGVPLLLLRPLLNEPALTIYNWLFVVAIIGAAFWLALAAYQHSDTLAASVERLVRASRRRPIALPAST